MPTSVLLAVLAAASLLALAPALVRRHDAAERQVAERAESTARVLGRTRRPRSVPGRRPVNPSQMLVPTIRDATPADAPAPADKQSSKPAAERPARRTGRARASTQRREPARERAAVRERAAARSTALAAVPRSAPPARRRTRPAASPAMYRRRRVLACLVLLNLVKLIGVIAVSPGFWVGFAVTATLLVAYLAHLRSVAVADRRTRRAEARRAAARAAHQAEVRLEQQRRAVARRDAARRLAEQREWLRRSPATWSAAPTVSYRPTARVRRDEAS